MLSGTARPESDVDLVILLNDSAALANDISWMNRFGDVQHASNQDGGLVQSKRVQYADGRQVAFSFTTSEWAATQPCDTSTLAVVRNGFRVVYDPKGLRRNLAIAAKPDQPERHVITSACGHYERRVWFVPAPSDGRHELAVFLDGEFYLHDVDCLPVIRERMALGGIPSMACAFVSFLDSESRHTDYTCNPAWCTGQARGWCSAHHGGGKPAGQDVNIGL